MKAELMSEDTKEVAAGHVRLFFRHLVQFKIGITKLRKGKSSEREE